VLFYLFIYFWTIVHISYLGNRWTPDQIYLTVDGRDCPDITTSQHDRRYIYSSADTNQYLQQTGRGACTSYPDMPAVDCSTVPPPALMECPSDCDPACDAPNQYCDCGRNVCMCTPGFSGDDCSFDICAPARCGENGVCTLRYLGGDAIGTYAACLCTQPWAGPTCEDNPCEGQTCNGHGTCVSLSAATYECQCDNGYWGSQCTETCNSVCPGAFPYGCPLNQDVPSYCGSNGGCSFGNNPPAGWCCYNNCDDDPCTGVECPIPTSDCVYGGMCEEGTCSAPTNAPDGSLCNSQLWGTCSGGVCIAHDGP